MLFTGVLCLRRCFVYCWVLCTDLLFYWLCSVTCVLFYWVCAHCGCVLFTVCVLFIVCVLTTRLCCLRCWLSLLVLFAGVVVLTCLLLFSGMFRLQLCVVY